jgi:lysophospholipase L1-like esterase
LRGRGLVARAAALGTCLLAVLAAPGRVSGGYRDSAAAAGGATYEAFGDSITAAAGNSHGRTYPQIIAAAKNLKLTNRAVSGYTSSEMGLYEVFPYANPAASLIQYYSILIGTNDADRKGAGPFEATYINNLEAAIAWLGTPSSSKVFAPDCAQSPRGSWNVSRFSPFAAGVSLAGQTAGYALTCTIEVGASGVLYGWIDGHSSFVYRIDGGREANPILPDAGVTLIRVTGLRPGRHSLTLTNTGGLGANFTAGIGTPPPPGGGKCCAIVVAGVPYQQDDAAAATIAATAPGDRVLRFAAAPSPLNSGVTPVQERDKPAIAAGTAVASSTAVTVTMTKGALFPGVGAGDTIYFGKHGDTAAYNKDAREAVAAMAADGINVVFMDIRHRLNPTTGMGDRLHPSQTGVDQIANGFLAAWPD